MWNVPGLVGPQRLQHPFDYVDVRVHRPFQREREPDQGHARSVMALWDLYPCRNGAAFYGRRWKERLTRLMLLGQRRDLRVGKLL